MPTAGLNSQIFVTTTAASTVSSSDQIGSVVSTGLNRTRAELDASYIDDSETSFVLGKHSAEVPLSCDYDSSNTGQTRLETAFGDGSTIYIHVDLLGSGTCRRVPCKVSAINYGTSQDGKVTFEATIKSVGSVASSTVS